MTTTPSTLSKNSIGLNKYIQNHEGKGNLANTLQNTCEDIYTKITEALPTVSGSSTLKPLIMSLLLMCVYQTQAQEVSFGHHALGDKKQAISLGIRGTDNTINPQLQIMQQFVQKENNAGDKALYFQNTRMTVGGSFDIYSHTSNSGNIAIAGSAGVYGEIPCNDVPKFDFEDAKVGATFGIELDKVIGNTNWAIFISLNGDVTTVPNGAKIDRRLSAGFNLYIN